MRQQIFSRILAILRAYTRQLRDRDIPGLGRKNPAVYQLVDLQKLSITHSNIDKIIQIPSNIYVF